MTIVNGNKADIHSALYALPVCELKPSAALGDLSDIKSKADLKYSMLCCEMLYVNIHINKIQYTTTTEKINSIVYLRKMLVECNAIKQLDISSEIFDLNNNYR